MQSRNAHQLQHRLPQRVGAALRGVLAEVQQALARLQRAGGDLLPQLRQPVPDALHEEALNPASTAFAV